MAGIERIKQKYFGWMQDRFKISVMLIYAKSGIRTLFLLAEKQERGKQRAVPVYSSRIEDEEIEEILRG